MQNHSQPRYIREENGVLEQEYQKPRSKTPKFVLSSVPLSLDHFSEFQQDVQQMRNAFMVLQEDRDALYRDYMESLSRWKTREARMRRVIDRQREVIHKMGRFIRHRSNGNMSSSPHQSPMSSFSSASDHVVDNMNRFVPFERQFYPPWELDMDDIRRQLQDIDETICRVEQAKSDLSNSGISRVILGSDESIQRRNPPRTLIKRSQ